MTLNLLEVVTLSIKMSELDKKLPENGGNIPIRALYVNAFQNYPKCVNEALQAFSHFGPIKSIFLSPNQVFFFLTFEKIEDAARVLAPDVTKKMYRTYKYKIRPADQWHQPLELSDGSIVWDRRQQIQCENPDIPEQTLSVDPTKPSLMDLDDDCLLLILRCLSLRELIGVERVCTRLRGLCFAAWSHVTALDFAKTFQPQQGVTMRVDHLREVLLRCGKYLTSLDLSAVHRDLSLPRAACQIVRHCPNLKELNLSNYGVREPSLKPMERIFKQLVKLKINGMLIDSADLKWILDTAQNLQVFEGNGLPTLSCSTFHSHVVKKTQGSIQPLHLTRLHVDSFKITLSHIFSKYPNLEDLKCSSLGIGCDVRNPVENRLKSLVVCRYYGSLESLLKDIALVLKSLEELSLTAEDFDETTRMEGFEEVARLKCLKRLHLMHLPLTDQDLITIANHTTGILEEFSCHHSDEVFSLSPARILASSPRMRVLDISATGVNERECFTEVQKSVRARLEPVPLTFKVSDDGPWGEPWPQDHLLNVEIVRALDCSKCDEDGSIDLNDILDSDQDGSSYEMPMFDEYDDDFPGYDSDLDFVDMLHLL